MKKIPFKTNDIKKSNSYNPLQLNRRNPLKNEQHKTAKILLDWTEGNSFLGVPHVGAPAPHLTKIKNKFPCIFSK